MPILEVKNLVKRFPISSSAFSKKRYVTAVNEVSFSLEEKQSLGVVGESGSGKSTLARLILGLLQPDSGSVYFMGENVHKAKGATLKKIRKNLQMVFQDPFSSLNPRQRVDDMLEEGMQIHDLYDKNERKLRCLDLLAAVGLEEESLQKYPHEFSGGQRQRLGIARAMSVHPQLMICDEAVSALDVSVQAQIINLLSKLKSDFALGYLFISHDLRVVQYISDQIAVMYLGSLVENLPSAQLLQCKHPYTQSLVASLPTPLQDLSHLKKALEGEPPSSINPPSGCSFHPRCSYAEELCKQQKPVLTPLTSNHECACHMLSS